MTPELRRAVEEAATAMLIAAARCRAVDALAGLSTTGTPPDRVQQGAREVMARNEAMAYSFFDLLRPR